MYIIRFQIHDFFKFYLQQSRGLFIAEILNKRAEFRAESRIGGHGIGEIGCGSWSGVSVLTAIHHFIDLLHLLLTALVRQSARLLLAAVRRDERVHSPVQFVDLRHHLVHVLQIQPYFILKNEYSAIKRYFFYFCNKVLQIVSIYL